MGIRLTASVMIAASCAAGQAAAEWRMFAPESEDDTGAAVGIAEGGTRLIVTCGNGGTALIEVTGPRVTDAGETVIDLRIDGASVAPVTVTCTAGGCFEAAPQPPASYSALARALAAGSTAEIVLNGAVIDTLSLAGSSAAIGAYRDLSACDGL